MAETWLTPEEIKKREERLEILKTTRRLEIAEQLKIARAFGDLSENAEYDAAKNEQAKNEYDIVQLESELKNAHVIDESSLDTTTVGIGATVKLTDMSDKTKKYTFQIVGSAETDPANGRISNESPIGKAVLGHKAGDVVEVVTPGGMLKLKVASIGK
ncbi:MAG TPA: transcription elongation factor GreA [Candidatus Cryosericum sp.]|nr:transcription elongation factor GreA [Candidatus Cryosericum sp.]